MAQKFVRLRLHQEDMVELVKLLMKGILAEKNPEKRWRLYQLATRLENPKRGHPRALTMETLSAVEYAVQRLQQDPTSVQIAQEAADSLQSPSS